MNEILSFIQSNIIISVAVATFILVQVIKQFVTDKRYMTVVAIVLGVILAGASNGGFSFEIFVKGLASGTMAIVLYDYGFEKLSASKDNAEPYVKGE